MDAGRADAAGVSGGDVHGQCGRIAASSTAGWLLITGFCGGFTTFSTFSADTVRLLRAGDYGPAAGYVVLSVGVCFVFTTLGMHLGSQMKG